MTIRDIAKEAGVSIATVSRVINKKHYGIGYECRNKVLEAIKKHKYVCNAYAQQLGRLSK